MPETPPPPSEPGARALSRRGLLRTGAGIGAAALGGAALLGSGAALLGATPAQAHGTLYTYGEIADFPTYYQNLDNGSVSGPRTFEYQANLYAKLEEWARYYFLNTPWWLQAPVQIWLNGTHVDSNPGMHVYGRAADISAFYCYNAVYGTMFRPLDGRWNIWKNDTVHPDEIRRWYWGAVSSLNIYFKYVLHYQYNSVHWNHVHVDNEASDGTYSTFSTGSRSQNQTVQSVCNYIFGQGTSVDGVWGPQTQSHSSAVLAASGWSGAITSSQSHWHRFLWAGFRAGYGLPITGSSLAAAASKQLPST
jgi:hypothetical protein